ncbi:CBS domain-containing protein [Streptomyces sp. NPDC058892]|uniref:CBS domain-containing protein n=1 Tax=unclassified Streptomyces TaxID=2593676 RepID=UPI000449F6D7|nr:CBS domain-containing protein [Streptomyces sp. PCS3-D2]WKV70492.1 CBS domain-containing protein [Streptomyces sp. PCS3-D2]
MKVSACMSAPAVSVEVATTIGEAARRMDLHGVGCLVVTEGGALRGIVTDRDIAVRAVAGGLDRDAPVGAVMTTPAVTVDAAQDIHAAYRALRTRGVRRLPVLDGHRVVGMLTVDDLLMDVFRRVADLLGPVAWSVLEEPPGPQDEIGPRGRTGEEERTGEEDPPASRARAS